VLVDQTVTSLEMTSPAHLRPGRAPPAAQPRGNVEITEFGLVPEFVGYGFGAHLLTMATRVAWDTEPIDASPIARVWLHTSSLDHPHALHNYRRRGFRQFDVRTRQREIP
jgi:ribosomal protein S18 acetylase RimI-like enzyme